MLGTEIKKRRFGVGEYHRMAEAGIFGEDDRLELADGEIVEMTPIGWRHVRAVTVLTQLLAGALPGYYVSVQNPIVFGERDERQPDLALVRAEALEGSLPEASDVALVVEVAETLLTYDREVKVQQIKVQRFKVQRFTVQRFTVQRFEVMRFRVRKFSTSRRRR